MTHLVADLALKVASGWWTRLGTDNSNTVITIIIIIMITRNMLQITNLQ